MNFIFWPIQNYSHFPENPDWQLNKIKYSLEDFLKWPQVFSNFFKFGFKKFIPERRRNKFKK